MCAVQKLHRRTLQVTVGVCVYFTVMTAEPHKKTRILFRSYMLRYGYTCIKTHSVNGLDLQYYTKIINNKIMLLLQPSPAVTVEDRIPRKKAGLEGQVRLDLVHYLS